MKNLILLSVTLLLTLISNAQIVDIPDANFKTALLENLSINTNGDNEIQVSEASAFTGNIDVGGLDIFDLTGIEAFTAIDSLYCYDNQLSTIDISNNTDLIYLHCHNNQLSTLDISNNTAITSIDCSENQLTLLDVSNNTPLEKLYCDDNLLTSLDVSNNTYLTSINCSENQLTLLDVSNNLLLEVLICGDNQLTSLDVSNNTALFGLPCNNNQLSTLDVSNNTNLTSIDCSENQLTLLDVSNNTILVSILCSGNQLNTIDISNNTAITFLRCSNNQLSTLDVSNNTNLHNLTCPENQLTSLDVSNNTALIYLNCYNNQLTSLDVSNNTDLTMLNCYNNNLTTLDVKNGNNVLITNEWFDASDNPNLYCIEVDAPIWSLANWTNIDTQTSFAYNCLYGIDYPNSITGKVVIDDNCILDGTEQGLQGIIVKTEPVIYYGITDNLGEYTISTDTGTYQVVQFLSDINELLVNPVCPIPNYHTISFDTLAQDTSDINFYNEVIACPYLTIDLSSNRRRRCFQNNTYINYCNEGYADASGVEVHVKFPEYVNLLSANYSYTIDSDGNYVFDIGALAQGDCGNIHIIDSVSCELGITGLTQCTEAWLTPINDCIETLDSTYNQWDHSSVMVEGECVGDTIITFTITNTGDFGEGDMQLTSEYRIYADNELVYTGTFQLNGQEELVIDVPANGQTIRLEADQHPMHPGNSHPQETIEACGDGAEPISMGFVNSVPMDDADANIEIDCLEIIDSYDPNDKSVSPQGITANNYLMPGIDLDYVIRFQNTGTDIAYTVVVIDTLSNNLDISTIQWGVSSHPYTLGISGQEQAVLQFNFYNINLPDSTTNEANSHGFVKFKITPYDTIANGTLIENTADIYFDYNLPIRTNTTYVIISDTVIMGDPIEINSLNDFNSNNLEIKIFPNPTKGKFSILTEDVVSIEILNLQGKLIYKGKETEIDLSNEPAGIYFVKVTTGKQTTTRKLIKN